MDSEMFVVEVVPECLTKLTENSKGQWGMMGPQHMIEHLVGSWRVSNGNATVACNLPEAILQQQRAFLLSDEPFEPNTKNPYLPENETLPFRKTNLKEAIIQLGSEIGDFFIYFDANPDVETTHPVYGDLNRAQWLHFQLKHMGHHFKQFGLFEYKEGWLQAFK